MKKRIAISVLIVAVLALTALTSSASAVPIGGHDIAFVDHTYNPATDISTWTYEVTSGFKPPLTYWVLEWCNAGAIVGCSEPCIKLKGDYSESDVQVATKDNKPPFVNYGLVRGPVLTLTVDKEGCCGIEVDDVTVTTPYSGTYDCCTEVKLEAITPDCCEFEKWVIDGTEYTTSEVTIHMDSDKTATAFCRSGKPDLIIESKTASCADGILTVTYTVSNCGECACASAPPSTTGIYVDGKLKGTDDVDALAKCTSYTKTVEIDGVSPGKHKVQVCADYNNAIDECDETNNCSKVNWVGCPYRRGR
jgi:hypothetical protein